jgi:acetoacetate decarboxylase
MAYTRPYKDLLKLVRAGDYLPEFTGAEMAWVSFRTDPAVVAAVLPRPLRLPAEPRATAFVARYPNTNFGLAYNEGALLVAATYKGEPGRYCLAMPVDDDMAMVAGREQFGYPKKMADSIQLSAHENHVVGSVVRRGVEIIRIEGDLTGGPEELVSMIGSADVDLDNLPCRKSVSWLFKYSPAARGGALEGAPLLVREAVLFRPREGLRSGHFDLKLLSSPTDPLGDVPVLEILAAGYGVFDNTMLPGRVVRKVRNVYRFLPKALFKYDWYDLIDLETVPARSWRDRRRLHSAIGRY